jgi:hypothetical protein
MAILRNAFQNRYFRHGIFWLTWILGFTFVKSFGETLDHYIAWLAYYILTLPIFVVHTYLIVYVAGKRLLKGWRVIWFIIVFLAALYLFSYLEILVTRTLLTPRWPAVFEPELNNYSPGNVVISGIGNLYILLVFIAARMVRSWYLSERDEQIMVKRRLLMERADANAGIQPNMLLHAVSGIEQHAMNNMEVSSAIATLSELMNAIMQTSQSIAVRVDEEIRNVKRMLSLYAMIYTERMPRLMVEGDDLSMKTMKAFMVFSPLEILFRRRNRLPDGPVSIVIESVEQVRISFPGGNGCSKGEEAVVQEELDQLYPGQFRMLTSGDGEIIISLKTPSA